MSSSFLALLILACNGDSDVVGPSQLDPGQTLPADEYDSDEDGFLAADDCDDYNADINPDAVEVCDGVDNNCDGDIDEDTAADAFTWHLDADQDGFGHETETVESCSKPDGYVGAGGNKDCDDDDVDVNPFASEQCDSIDNDCDNEIDEGSDDDEDGYDDVCDGDCDDAMAEVNPAADEVCDEVDNDCDGTVDGASAEGAVSVWLDDDGDTFGDPAEELVTCDVEGALGYVENDGDCDDSNAAVNPDATEVCDGTVDDNCDGTIDEGLGGTYYTDGDSDGYGDDGSEFQSCSDPGTGYVTQGGDCDDSADDVNPDEAEVCNDWVDNDCDDTDNGCTPAGSVASDALDVMIQATSVDEALGFAVAGGDANDDGTPDLMCGAYGADIGGTDDGTAYLFYSPGDDSTTADGKAFSPDLGDDAFAGRSASLGDLDDDGKADLAVGAWGVDSVSIFTGKLLAGRTGGDIVITDATDATGNFGIALAADGDLNGDGVADLAIGATTHSNTAGGGSGNDGAVFVFYGPLTAASYDVTDADAVLEGPTGGGQVGGWVAYVGDVLGAGADNLAIGARYDDGAASDAGAIYLVSGIFSGTVELDTSATAIVEGIADSDQLWHAAGAGDLNGDGTDDLVAGAYVADDAATNGGALYVLDGPLGGTVSASTASATIYGEENGGGLGYDVAGAGDVNGDGELDLIVGAPYKDGSGGDPGQAFLYYGPFAGSLLASDADLLVSPTADNDFLGGAVAGIGDVNGDGYDDVALGDYQESSVNSGGGACYVLYGGGI